MHRKLGIFGAGLLAGALLLPALFAGGALAVPPVTVHIIRHESFAGFGSVVLEMQGRGSVSSLTGGGFLIFEFEPIGLRFECAYDILGGSVDGASVTLFATGTASPGCKLGRIQFGGGGIRLSANADLGTISVDIEGDIGDVLGTFGTPLLSGPAVVIVSNA